MTAEARDRVRVNSCDPAAQVPEVGSVWVWELDAPWACCLIRVVEVRWNGEEWWVKTVALLPAHLRVLDDDPYCSDADRFAEAVTPVGPAGWTTHAVTKGVEFVAAAPSRHA